ncbi:MAG: SelB C-terminal domain-containing protein [Verrucomicrobiota bacterium]
MRKPRLPIDRAFSPKGVGTVVTGTLIDGNLETGQDLVIQPAGIEASVRNVQSHSENQGTVPPGTRTALNLTGVSVAQKGAPGVSRGSVATHPSLGQAVTVIDVRLDKTDREVPGQKQSARPLQTGRQVSFHYGSASFPARLHLLGSRQLDPGSSILAELRFSDPIFVFLGDTFILRDPSLGLTLAGGVVLDEDANRRMFRKPWQAKFLEARRDRPDDLEVLLCSQLERDKAASLQSLLRKSRFSQNQIRNQIDECKRTGILAESGSWIFDGAWWKRMVDQTAERVQAVHHDHPELPGFPIRDLRAQVEPELPYSRLFEVLLDGLLSGDFAKAGPCLRHRDHVPRLPPELKKTGEDIRTILGENLVAPPNKGEVVSSPEAEKALRFLQDIGEVIELDPKTIISTAGYQKIREGVRAHLEASQKATASELREATSTSRRILMPVLERLDAEGLTMRLGDERILKKR